LKLKNMKEHLSGNSVLENLRNLAGLFPGKTVFTTSFGAEDQVITHLIFSGEIPVTVSTLDTGRLFRETYETFSNTIIKYRKNIKVYYPETGEVEKLVTEKGPFSFYDSVENRKECCHIRKVVPLNRSLEGMKCWISGIRADQSDNRSNMDWLEYDEERQLFKFYPLFNWTFNEVMNFLRINRIPFNPLHNKGFLSIGCEPCTRAIMPGEDFRAGRWWWEAGKKECGLHEKDNGSEVNGARR
jgi:phosphoadenosine phosphosulfate reductase